MCLNNAYITHQRQKLVSFEPYPHLSRIHIKFQFTLKHTNINIVLYHILLCLLCCIVLYCVVLYWECILLCLLYCIVLYCVVLYWECILLCLLYCIVLYCVVLYWECILLCLLYCIVLYCVVLYWECILLCLLYCIVLYCVVLYWECILLCLLYCIVLYCVVELLCGVVGVMGVDSNSFIFVIVSPALAPTGAQSLLRWVSQLWVCRHTWPYASWSSKSIIGRRCFCCRTRTHWCFMIIWR